MSSPASSLPGVDVGLSPMVRVLSWVCRLLAAGILLQTLFFKFSGAPESIHIFTTVGMEPWGRYASGAAELVAAILLVVPATAALGAVLGLGVMSGALFFHATKLGVVVQNDGGLLFGLAVTVFACCALVVFIHRQTLLRLVARRGPAAVSR